MDYYQKYLKYKNKYLQLKAELEGGIVTPRGSIEYCKKKTFGTNESYVSLRENGDNYIIEFYKSTYDAVDKFNAKIIHKPIVKHEFTINKSNPNVDTSDGYVTITIKDANNNFFTMNPTKKLNGVYKFNSEGKIKSHTCL